MVTVVYKLYSHSLCKLHYAALGKNLYKHDLLLEKTNDTKSIAYRFGSDEHIPWKDCAKST